MVLKIFRVLAWLLVSALILSLLGVASIIAARQYMEYRIKDQQFTTVTTVPSRRVGMVFGAQVRPDGSLSPILRDRVDTGVALYQAGKVQKLLMTGDNSKAYYDEVTAMRRYALEAGVPEEDIALDYAGFDTYDSCYRAQALFSVDQAILVTQRFHLPRALYLCRTLGIDAVGVAVPDFERYPNLRWPYTLRENLATVKALWQVHVAHSQPTVLGPKEPPI